ncbi:MAG TPA: hypothetical protein VEJ63_15545 [Planctomycetota bacterium]|nr:hypothetical protein [Planctomycetota bacterium]
MKQHTETPTTLAEPNVGALKRPLPSIRKPDENEHKLGDYADMLKRRWKLAATIAGGLMALITLVILAMPSLYRGEVLVVLQSPTIHAATGGGSSDKDIQQKLAALREQVDSRRTLKQVIKKFDLYSASTGTIPEDQIYEMMRKSITLKLGKTSFNLYYEHPDPQTAADVANELARHYIEESTRIRRESLENTSAFIGTQLRRLERDVKDMESTLTDFRKRNWGSLPEDVPANQALLMALSSQVSQTEANLDGERLRKRKAEDRITELLSTEITNRIRDIKKATNALRRLPDFDNPNAEAPQPMVKAAFEEAAPHAIENPELKRLSTRLEEIEAALARSRAMINPTPQQTAEANRLKEEQEQLKTEIQKIAAAPRPQLPPQLANELDGGLPATDDVETEMLREQLRAKEAAVAEAERNAKDLEDLQKKGFASEPVVRKAKNDLEAARAAQRIARAQVMKQRAQTKEQLATNEADLAALKEFQQSWNEMMQKIQEIEAQRLRITSQSSEEQIQSATKRIENLNGELAEMRKKQSESPTMRQLFSSRGELAQQVQEHENIMTALARQQNDIQATKLRIADLDRRLTNSARVQIELPELLRKYKTITDQYEAMLRQKMQADVNVGIEDQAEGERMVIWDPAIKQSSPYKPKYALLFGGGLVFALSAGVALAILLELLAPKFLQSETVRQRTGMEVLAEIDELPSREVPPVPEGMPASCARVVTLTDPWHRVSKQFMDSACLLFKPHTRWPRVVAVCSPGYGDGKTFVATNLAAAVAMSTHETTILVDANLRTPALHTTFDLPREGGLAEALEGGAIHVHQLKGTVPCELQLMTSGHVQRHGAVLLGSTRFKEMMDKITYQGNKPRIILDTPPLKGGADVDVLLDAVDGVLLVVRRGHTQIAEVERAVRRIPPEKLLGVIFNGRTNS